ncbi:cytochrome P450 4C1 [Orussus abietinus]|uniref:cytochrome P450 4C1 n=1 Tax=Orussus abietinus TaxID=222816 RepID=UPI0006255C49|nr:cytochrome P450 4C1 [Orussus abietinus]
MIWSFASRFVEDRDMCFWISPVFASLFLGAVFFSIVLWLTKSLRKWWHQRVKMLKLAASLPGPPALPIIGNALSFACSHEDILCRIDKITRTYESPFRFWLGPRLFVVLTRPEDIEVVLNNPKAQYKDRTYRFLEPFIGKGLITESGPRHRAHRKLIMPMLNSKSLAVCVEYFDKHSRYCADLLVKKCDDGEFDVAPFLTKCTVDVMLDTIMGVPGNAQTGNYLNLIYWTEKMYEMVYTRIMKVWLHCDWIFDLTDLGNQQKTGRSVIYRFVESVVTRKKKEHSALKRGVIRANRPRLMVLEQLIDQLETTKSMDDQELKEEIYTLFTAAQDTVAVVSSFALLMLAMHPEIQDKVRQELLEVLGADNITAEYLANMKYTDMVVRETLRLFPIAPITVRRLEGDIELDSCTIPEGCSIVLGFYSTHRCSKYWSEPEKFIPERFLPENSIDRHPYAYLPFSSGVLGCIGQKFAIMCLKTVIGNVVRRYKLSSNSKIEDIRLKSDISVRSKDGYRMSIHRV